MKARLAKICPHLPFAIYGVLLIIYIFLCLFSSEESTSFFSIGELPEELSTFANRSWAHVDFTVFNRVTKEILFGIEVDGYNYRSRIECTK